MALRTGDSGRSPRGARGVVSAPARVGASSRNAASPRTAASSPAQSAADRDWDQYTQSALRELDRTIKDPASSPFPGLQRTAGTPGGKSNLANIQQAEALEAANAIDAVLRKRAEPVHERLKDSLTSTLRSRARIAKSFSEVDVEGTASARGIRTGLHAADIAGGSGTAKSFGKQLAASWTSLPDTGLAGGRSRLLEKLDGTQAARVRGLLTHLEFSVQADPSVSAASLLNMSEDSTPVRNMQSQPLDATSLFNQTQYGVPDDDDEPIVSTLPQEDPWPYDRFRHENRMRCSGYRGQYKVSGSAAQRLLSFRENLLMAYSSLGEAFSAMDMDGRNVISYDHFHAHLVRLKLSRVDAEGSIRSAEMFKLLDADSNDLITPNDCLRAFEAAAREIRVEIKQAAFDQRYHENALKHGYVEGADHVRLDKREGRPRLELTGDDALRIFTLRRFYELQNLSLIDGLKTLDAEKTEFLRKEAFICGLIEDGYCVSASEAMDLFKILDVWNVGALSLRYLNVLDQAQRLGTTSSEHRPPLSLEPQDAATIKILEHPKGQRLPSGIGSGGLFSDPGRLDGPRPPPRPHARLGRLRDWDPEQTDDLFKRLYTQKTSSYDRHTHREKPRKSEQPQVIIDKLLATLDLEKDVVDDSRSRRKPEDDRVPSREARTNAREAARSASPGLFGGGASPRQRGEPPPSTFRVQSSRPPSPSSRSPTPKRNNETSSKDDESRIKREADEKRKEEEKKKKADQKQAASGLTGISWLDGLVGGDGEEDAADEDQDPRSKRRARLRTAQRVGGAAAFDVVPKFSRKTAEAEAEAEEDDE